MAKSQEYLVTGETQKVVRYDNTYNLVHGEMVDIGVQEDADAMIEAGLVTDDYEESDEEPIEQAVDPSTGAWIPADEEASPESNSYTDPPREGSEGDGVTESKASKEDKK